MDFQISTYVVRAVLVPMVDYLSRHKRPSYNLFGFYLVRVATLSLASGYHCHANVALV